MFAQSMGKTEMTRFWQFMFDFCNEEYSCVLGWGMAGVIAFLGVVMCFGYFITRLAKTGSHFIYARPPSSIHLATPLAWSRIFSSTLAINLANCSG
jgi:hypothetical protein